MAIQYIKIIREIMGPEAEKRGYKITAGPKLSTKKYLAFFNRKISGRSQGFDIEKDYILDCALTLTCCGKEIIAYDNDDEATFRQCIQQFQDFMMDEGYSLLEKAAKIPVFSHEDKEYVKLNYEQIGDKFFEGHERSLSSDIDLIVERLDSIMDKDWDDVMGDLREISGALTSSLIEFVDNAELRESRVCDDCYVEAYTADKNFRECPMNLVYDAYQYKDTQEWIIDMVKELL